MTPLFIARARYQMHRFVLTAVAFFWIGVAFAGLLMWATA